MKEKEKNSSCVKPSNSEMNMLISGFQKFSLIDYPGKLSAIVFTRGCNFNCPWCHNPELVDPELFIDLISPEYIISFLKQRIGKLDAITITGGEPTLHHDLPQFIKEIKTLGFSIKLDTNGSNPELLSQLLKENLLDYLAMDIKAPFHKYHLVSQSTVEINLIKKSLEIIKNSNIPYEFRTTYIPYLLNESDLNEIKTYLDNHDKYVIQPFHSEKLLDNSFDFSPEITHKLWLKMKTQISGVSFRD